MRAISQKLCLYVCTFSSNGTTTTNCLMKKRTKKTKHDEHVLSAALVSVTESDHGRREEFAAKRGSFVVLFFFSSSSRTHNPRDFDDGDRSHISISSCVYTPTLSSYFFIFKRINKTQLAVRHTQSPQIRRLHSRRVTNRGEHTHIRLSCSFLFFVEILILSLPNRRIIGSLLMDGFSSGMMVYP